MKRKQRLICGALAASMIVGVCVHPAADMQAAKKKKASLAKKKITVQVGEKKSITIKNKVKKAVYKFKTSSKLIKVSKKGVITAKKAGKAKVTVSETYKKKTRKLGTVTVTITDKTKKATQKPAGTAAPNQPGTTVNPAATTNPSASVNPAASGTPAPANTPEVSKEPVVSPDPEASLIYRNMFEDGNLNGFQENGGRIEISNSVSHGGINSLLCTDRANIGDGAEMNISDMVITGRVCQFSAWVMQDSGQEERISMGLSYKDADGKAQYMSLVYGAPDGQACPSGEWVHLSGVYEMPANSTELMLTITSPTSATADLYIDDVEIYGKKEFAEDEFPMTNELRDDMTAKSIVSTGNNAKIKNVIEKARAGQDVTLAYIGGSITEGGGYRDNSKCYAQVSATAFAETYGTNGGSNVHFINAGMSGTPSSLGVIRYERDVLDRVEYGDHPDILFIEFSVNDYQEVTNCGAYEGLIRYALKNDTAVVMIFSVFNDNNVVCQPQHIPYGEHYSVPMISLGNATVDYYKEPGFYDWYYNDTLHPNANGYQLMSDCIMKLFDEIDQEEKKEDIDVDDIAPKNTDAYEGIKYLDAATDITKDAAIKELDIGGFTGTDKSTGAFQYEYNGQLNAAWFPNNWMHTGDAPLAPWKITVNCRTFMLIYKLSNSSTFGKADLYVDGEKKTTLSCYDSSGWNNGSVYVAFTEKEAAEHTIELVMADGDEAKSFTLSAVGYK